MRFFIREVDVSPLLLDLHGNVRFVERSPLRRSCPVKSRSVLTGEARFLFLIQRIYALGWLPTICCLLRRNKQKLINISHITYRVAGPSGRAV